MRVENWPSVLMAMVEKAEREPFVWGKNDCCLWVADIVKAMTGKDFAEGMRGKYSTIEEAVEIYNGFSLLEYINTILENRISINFAQRGDVVMAKFPVGETLGICIGGMAAFKTLTGLIQIPMLNCDHAWRIG